MKKFIVHVYDDSDVTKHALFIELSGKFGNAISSVTEADQEFVYAGTSASKILKGCSTSAEYEEKYYELYRFLHSLGERIGAQILKQYPVIVEIMHEALSRGNTCLSNISNLDFYEKREPTGNFRNNMISSFRDFIFYVQQMEILSRGFLL